MKKLLICGGEGFIGRNCIEHFKKTGKYQITSTYFTSIKHKPIEGVKYIQVDLRNESEVKQIVKDQHIIIHAAATTTGSKDVIERPYVHVTDNAVMNSWLFREAHLNKVEHLIFFSCTVMYQPNNEPQKESDWSANDEIYGNYFGVGNMKVFSENMCNFYSRLGNTKFTAIRHSNVYGPYDKFDLDKCHVLPAFINKIINSNETLDVWGDGSAKRDIIYIDDLVDMVDKVINKQSTKYKLYNCGAGKAYSIKELANVIMDVNNKQLTIEYDISKPNIPTVVILDCVKANKELDWYPTTKVEDGIQITSNWYKEKFNIK